MLRLLLIAGTLGLWQQSAVAQATQPADDAAKLYLQAAKLIDDNYARKIMSPAASNLTFPPFPPYSTEWKRTEQIDYAANTEARALRIRQDRSRLRIGPHGIRRRQT